MNTMCICQPGFLNASGTCSTCPTGATSTDGNFSSSTAGFWSNSKVFPPCPLGTGSCAGNVACLATFTGELCALCKPGNARQENSCIDCMASIWSLPMPCPLIACSAMGEPFFVIRYLTFWRCWDYGKQCEGGYFKLKSNVLVIAKHSHILDQAQDHNHDSSDRTILVLDLPA